AITAAARLEGRASQPGLSFFPRMTRMTRIRGTRAMPGRSYSCSCNGSTALFVRGEGAHGAAVVAELGDRVVDVAQRGVCGLLADAGQHVGRPAARQFLDGADVEVAVVEEALELRHAAVQEAAVLADGVAADRRLVGLQPAPKELQRARLGFG